jgi:hypothetical protein
MSAATRARNVGVPALPLGAISTVFAVCELKFEAATLKVPPSVRLPVEVTVPLSVSPLTVPVPPTEVTVPVVLLVPAPMAVLKVAASKLETVLSALTLRNVTAVGLVSVNRLLPTVEAKDITLENYKGENFGHFSTSISFELSKN